MSKRNGYCKQMVRGMSWWRQSEQEMNMLQENEHLLEQDRAERENPGARASMQREVVVVGTKK